VTGLLGGRRVRVSGAGSSTPGAARLARGRIGQVLGLLRNRPSERRAPPPGSYRLPVAGGQE
jgi:hypothetical protein